MGQVVPEEKEGKMRKREKSAESSPEIYLLIGIRDDSLDARGYE